MKSLIGVSKHAVKSLYKLELGAKIKKNCAARLIWYLKLLDWSNSDTFGSIIAQLASFVELNMECLRAWITNAGEVA